MLGAAKNAEEKSKKAMVDAARLADELRAEQDHASTQASSKQSLNNQFGQLEARLADAENAAAKGGKAAMAKLENKVHELEAELAGTQARTGEAAKAYQRAERKCKELVFSKSQETDPATELLSVEFGKKSGPFCKPLESKQPCRYKSCQSAESRSSIDVYHLPSGGALWFILMCAGIN